VASWWSPVLMIKGLLLCSDTVYINSSAVLMGVP
jgi:hypothetical protein